MIVERFFVEGLAHASYLFGKDGLAAVVDPKRDVDDYIRAAERQGWSIVAIFETHPHADFVSGHVELAERTGASIYVSNQLPAEYRHIALAHGEQFAIGGLAVTALHTPGHSPDSLSIFVEDGDERAVFTGDALFVGDVGRPDLRDMHADPSDMAVSLYDTLRHVLYALPDDTVVWPAHGAGSLCGRRLGTAPSTTIGNEKTGNWANRFETREAFVEAMISNLPERPIFFYKSPFLNLAGARPLSEVPRPERIDPLRLAAPHSGVVLIDTRPSDQYGAAHIQGSLNIGIEQPVFSTWVGSLLHPDEALVLVVNDEADAAKAWLDLARIGYENVAGYLVADLPAWKSAGLPVRETPQLEVTCVDEWVKQGRHLLDVRTPGELAAGSISGCINMPLSRLQDRMEELPAGPLATTCGGGYRSSLAASLLERAGRRDVVNLRGGWAAYAHRDASEPDSQQLFCQALFDRMPVPA